MLRHIDLPRALLRGRYMAAAATMEHTGVPLDTPLLAKLREQWSGIQDRLIAEIDANYGVFEGRTFKADRFAALLEREGIPWPRRDSGRLDLSDDAFRQAARTDARIAPLRELRSSLSELRLYDLAVGEDGRNRCLLSAFCSRTGRNQPSNSKFIFGPSVWLRGLIKPPPGYGLAYIDWAQQEFGIAGALSGDQAMMAAYQSGDPYLAFAKQAGAVPAHATKYTHQAEREQFKQCVLAVQYGMGPDSLAARIGQPPIVGRQLIRLHQEAYSVFWRWSDSAVDHAMLSRSISTVFGWRVNTSPNCNPRFFRNFPMQANGAEMLRLACCLATERGIEVCAPVHDAVLIAAPLHRLDDDVATMREAMREASLIVLDGFELTTDVKVVRYPGRYEDPRGKEMWARVMGLIGEGPIEANVAPERQNVAIREVFSIVSSTCKSKWDPNRFKLEHNVAQGIGSVSRRKSHMMRMAGMPFLRGPIPMHWLHEASKLGVSALWVGCVLWHLAGLKKTSTFLVSNLHLHRWGIDRRAKSRALKALSNAGLITVEGRGKRSPRVTIVVADNEGADSCSHPEPFGNVRSTP